MESSRGESLLFYLVARLRFENAFIRNLLFCEEVEIRYRARYVDLSFWIFYFDLGCEEVWMLQEA